MKKLARATLATLIVLYSLNFSSAANALIPCNETSGKVAGRDIGLTGEKCEDAQDPSQQSWYSPDRTKTVRSGPKLKYRFDYSTLCSINTSGRDSCIALTDATCPNGDPLISRSLVALNGPRRGQVLNQATYCGEDEPPSLVPGAENDVARLSIEQFRRLAILPSKMMSQPKGFSLKNGYAHLYAIAKPQNFTVKLFDQSVRVRALPTTYKWTYGDGTQRALTQPGHRIAEHSFSDETPTSHVYKETGDFSVGLTTSFRGEYSTEGGPWTPIPGTANVPSEPMPMSVWRTKKLLVDRNCVENPDGPACDSPFLKEKSTSK